MNINYKKLEMDVNKDVEYPLNIILYVEKCDDVAELSQKWEVDITLFPRLRDRLIDLFLLSRLTTRMGDVLRGIFQEGNTVSEISDRWNVSKGHVQNNIRWGLEWFVDGIWRFKRIMLSIGHNRRAADAVWRYLNHSHQATNYFMNSLVCNELDGCELAVSNNFVQAFLTSNPIEFIHNLSNVDLPSLIPEKSRSDCFYPMNDDVSIEELGLSTRALNALRKVGIEAVFHLESMTKSDILSIRNIGKSTAQEILNKLEFFGFHIKDK